MSAFEQFKQALLDVTEGVTDQLVQNIDGYDITLTSMPYGYYLCGRLPVQWNGSEQELQAHLHLSMMIFSQYEVSLGAACDSHELYLSLYMAKPKSLEELLSHVEPLVNILDVWPAMLERI